MRLFLISAAILTVYGNLYAHQLSAANISSTSFMLHTNENTGTILSDSSPDNKTCTTANSPVWVNINGITALKFDNTNARIACTELDMPYGQLSHTFMTMIYMTTPTVGGYFHVMGLGVGGASRLALWQIAGGKVNVDRGTPNTNYNIHIPTQTWCVVGAVYDSASLTERAFVVTKDMVQFEDSGVITYNIRNEYHQWGDWSISGANCRCSLTQMTIINRALSSIEFINRARQMLGMARHIQ